MNTVVSSGSSPMGLRTINHHRRSAVSLTLSALSFVVLSIGSATYNPAKAQTCRDFNLAEDCLDNGGTEAICNHGGDSGVCVSTCDPPNFPDWCSGHIVLGDIEPCRRKQIDCDGDDIIDPDACRDIPGDYEDDPVCECIPHLRRAGPGDPDANSDGIFDEIPNGVDDDCDGLIDNESCDGIDNDGNGFVDDEDGTCLTRILVAPFCWDYGDGSFRLTAEAEVSAFISSAGISGCADSRVHVEYLDLETNPPFDDVECEIWRDKDRAEDCKDTMIGDLADRFRADHASRLQDIDTVAFFTNQNVCGRTAGQTSGRFTWNETDPSDTPNFVFAHEMGHRLRLGDEYCSELATGHEKCNGAFKSPSGDRGDPNFLGVDLGCSPVEGQGCCDDCDGYTACCEGNINPRGGRCIMSFAGADEPRAFCERCADWIADPSDSRWNRAGIRGPGNPGGQVPMDCSFIWDPGATPIVNPVFEMAYDLGDDGRVRVRHHEFMQTRLPLAGIEPDSEYALELVEPGGGSLAIAAADADFHHEEPDRRPQTWVNSTLLLPNPGHASTKYKVRAFKSSIRVSEFTLNGEPPVADPGTDRRLECSGDLEASTTLDATGSSDPDGDLLTFVEWTLAGQSIAPDDVWVFQRAFPLGTFEVELRVHDGLFESAPELVEIIVEDTKPPETSCEGDTVECEGELTPVETECEASDICDTDIEPKSTADPSYPLGEHEFSCTATDVAGHPSESRCKVFVLDRTPPEITLSSEDLIRSCHPGPSTVHLPLPTVEDSCGQGDPELTGKLIAFDGRPLVPELAIPPTGEMVLRPGVATVEWRAEDRSGNVALVVQQFTIDGELTPDCCSSEQSLLVGTANQDFLVRNGGAWCIFAEAGGDFVQTSAGNDFLVGGDGSDNLNPGAGTDRVFGGDGDDAVNCGFSGRYEAHGGRGNDAVQGFFCDAMTAWGASGDDNITGSSYNDQIAPGSGHDSVHAGPGDDTVLLYDVCELQSGKQLAGGPGHDTLVTPVSEAELAARGVTIDGFETISVVQTLQHLSDCF